MRPERDTDTDTDTAMALGSTSANMVTCPYIYIYIQAYGGVVSMANTYVQQLQGQRVADRGLVFVAWALAWARTRLRARLCMAAI